jgi:hypothetical protein
MPDEEGPMSKGNKSSGTGQGLTRSPNDQRSDVFNPTSAENKAARDNRSRQMNPIDARHPSNAPGKPKDK